MRENSAYKHRLRIAGIALAGVFGFLIGVAILCATHPEWGLHSAFSSVCHQQPHRSHKMDGVPLGVCIRCFWLYVGLFLGHGRFVFCHTIPNSRVLLLGIAVTLGALDWVSGWITPTGNPVWLRMTTSIVIGISVSHFTVSPLAKWVYQENQTRKNKHKS